MRLVLAEDRFSSLSQVDNVEKVSAIFLPFVIFSGRPSIAIVPHDAIRRELDDVVSPCFSTGDPLARCSLGVQQHSASVKRQVQLSV